MIARLKTAGIDIWLESKLHNIPEHILHVNIWQCAWIYFNDRNL